MALKLSPVHEIALRGGATMAEEAGWLIPQSYEGVRVSTSRVGLIDESGFGKIMIHGRAGGQVAAVLGIEPPEAIGQGVFAGDTAVYRLRADQLFVSTPPGSETVALAAADTGGERVTITDVTHGRAQLRLVGPASAELLGRLCGLDLRADHFPDHTARQTSVAKTTQLIIRHDLVDHDLDDGRLLSYSIIGARSLGAYLWETILDSGSDLGIRPLGTNDL